MINHCAAGVSPTVRQLLLIIGQSQTTKAQKCKEFHDDGTLLTVRRCFKECGKTGVRNPFYKLESAKTTKLVIILWWFGFQPGALHRQCLDM